MRTAHIILIRPDQSAELVSAGPFDAIRAEFRKLKLNAGETAEFWSKTLGNPKTLHGKPPIARTEPKAQKKT